MSGSERTDLQPTSRQVGLVPGADIRLLRSIITPSLLPHGNERHPTPVWPSAFPSGWQIADYLSRSFLGSALSGLGRAQQRDCPESGARLGSRPVRDRALPALALFALSDFGA